MLFRVSFGCHIEFHSKFLSGFVYGFFGVDLWFLWCSFQVSCRGFLSEVLITISLRFLWVSPRVFGYKQEWIKHKKRKQQRKQRRRKYSSKNMTDDKKKWNSRSRKAQKHESREAEKQGKQKRKEAGKAEKQRSMKSTEVDKQRSRKS